MSIADTNQIRHQVEKIAANSLSPEDWAFLEQVERETHKMWAAKQVSSIVNLTTSNELAGAYTQFDSVLKTVESVGRLYERMGAAVLKDISNVTAREFTTRAITRSERNS